MDVSADLMELARNPVGLVSAGVKSILDIGRTLEYLVDWPSVYGSPQTKDFPAFFSPKSGHQLSWNVDNPHSAAQVLYTQDQFGMQNGTLIGVPIPREYEEEGLKIQKAVDQAVEESEANGLAKRGKEVTPWLLRRVSELTQGRSQLSNIALLKNTALVGGQIAVEYNKLVRNETEHDQLAPTAASPSSTFSFSHRASTVPEQPKASPKLVVIGSSAVDITARSSKGNTAALANQSTVSGSVSLSLGGVARNIAEASYRASSDKDSVMLLSPVADDMFGSFLRGETSKLGMREDGLVTQKDHRTATCNMILDGEGHLVTGIADMGIIENLTPQPAVACLEQHRPSMVALDGNMSPKTLAGIVRYCKQKELKVLFEPTSVMKSTSILQAISENLDNAEPPITYITPNLLELQHIFKTARETYDLFSQDAWWRAIDGFSVGTQYRNDLEHLSRVKGPNNSSSMAFLVQDGVAQMALNLLPFFKHIIIKCGSLGAIVVMRASGETEWSKQNSNVVERCIVSHGTNESVVLIHLPALPAQVVNVTGAGDSFVGALSARLVERPLSFNDMESLKETVNFAQQAAVLTLASELAVSPRVSDLARTTT
ncbi:hypothetical protein AAF712_000790 [Marasmius tenuissimus]|uniref:Carbohydrate kinase PfkB domain-containing protein n=1 Tax=Marasmius tenuissimus TaxID=585030 RepID=A0ABR3AFT1_9AGAR